jgi:steroid delta-isomerase-like uncharacterized protein
MTAEDNKALMRRWHDEMNKHNADICDELLADTYTEHNNMVPQPLDKAGAKGLLSALFVAIPDMHRDVVEQVAEGDTVVERLRYSGTQKGEMMGIAATGRSATFDAVMVSRIRNGQIAEIWALLDSMSFMQQLGVIPSPGG